MKTGNIGIRNLTDIGVADIDVYGTDRRKLQYYSRTEKVKLRIGVFFDGTGNNRFNSDDTYYKQKLPIDEETIPLEGKKKRGTSYWNSYSNVALLYDLYQEKLNKDPNSNVKFQEFRLKHYVEGIGTFKDKEDDPPGLALGEGEYGVVERVKQACDEIVKKVKNILNSEQNIEIISLQFDVFGFSRGAAAARHFCNEVLKENKFSEMIQSSKQNQKNVKSNRKIHKEKAKIDNLIINKTKDQRLKEDIPAGGYFEKKFRNELKNVIYPKDIVTIECLGLFDTVISQMLEKYGIVKLLKNRKLFFNKLALENKYNLINWLTIKNIQINVELALSLISDKIKIDLKDIPLVNPSVNHPMIKNVFHLTAMHEWRENFPLTSVPVNPRTKIIGMAGAHSDIGGGYANTTIEKNILHFIEEPLNATDELKETNKLFRKNLLQWYTGYHFCKNDSTNKEIEWKEYDHILKTLNGTTSFTYYKYETSFMDGRTEFSEDGFHYELLAKHYELQSSRVISNKLSLVAMKVMKHLAQNFAGVPFLEPSDQKLIPPPLHKEEYILPKELEKYCEDMKKIAESRLRGKDGTIKEYRELYADFENGIYDIDDDLWILIKNKYVHLSANYNEPILDSIAIDHKQIAYTNVPQFNKDENKIKDEPYQRLEYTPKLSEQDKKNSISR